MKNFQPKDLFRWFMCGPLWGALALLVIGASGASAYSTVTLSTAAPNSVEDSFIAMTTNFFDVSLVKNPLASRTWSVKLFGIKSKLPAVPSTLEQALSLGATVYVYGFADGQAYERKQDLGVISSYAVNLSTATMNCAPLLGQMENDIYTMNFSTPTIIPPPQP